MIDARQFDIGKYNPVDFETLTIDNTVGGIPLTASKVVPTNTPKRKKVLITVESAPIRYRIDGTAPTATTGHLLLPMSSLILEGYLQMSQFLATRQGATSGTIMVTYLI